MAIVAAELLARVSADTTRAQRDLSAFSRHLQDTTTGWNRMLTGAGKALGVAFGAAGGFAAFAGVTSLTGAVQSLVGEAADAYAYSERLRMSLSSMAARELMQSGQATDMASALAMAGDRAKELEYWVRQVAIESPFDRRNVADAFRLAMAYGFTSEQAQRLTQATIDFSTATGQSGDVMQRISLALGQIQARGKLSAQELNQLSEAGVNARQILADAFGVSTAKIMEMIERGLVPAGVVVEAVLADIERNYAGAGKAAQQSLQGVLNSLGDLKEARLEDLFGPTFASVVVPALLNLAETMQSPEFIAGTQALGTELGKVAALSLDGVAGALERMSVVMSTPMDAPGWMKVLTLLFGENATITPEVTVPEQVNVPKPKADWTEFEWTPETEPGAPVEVPVTAKVVSLNWQGAEDGGWLKVDVDADGKLRTIDLYGGETTGWDGGKFEGGRLVIDTDAQVVKIGYGAGADKDLLALKFTADWREGSLVKLAAGAYNTVAAELAKGWTANAKLIPDISEILEVLSQPFQVVANFVTGNEEKTERTTESVSAPETPSAQLFYDPYSVKIELEPDTAALDSTLGADYSTTTTIDPDWGTTWQQIYTAKVDLQPIGPINVQVNPVIGGSHNFPRRPSSTVPSDILGSPGFAAGGTHSGGLAVVGERGAELAFYGDAWRILGANGPQVVNLPAGVEIIPADVTRRMMQGGAAELSGALPIPAYASGTQAMHDAVSPGDIDVFPAGVEIIPADAEHQALSDSTGISENSQITAFASGTGERGEAAGIAGRTGTAVVGEQGPELAFDGTSWSILGENGPELANIAGLTEILPAAETQRMMQGGAPELAGKLPIPGYASGVVSATLRSALTPRPFPGFANGTTPTPTTPDLKAAGEAAAKSDWATYKALMGLTDAVESNTSAAKAQSKALTELASMLSSVEGLFGTSQVTAQQMELAELGVPQNFADDYLRRLTDEVINGVDWEGVDIGDAAARAGIDPNLPAEAILSMFRSAWADSSLFADAQNLDLINQDAVQAALQRQRDSETGQANIMALFGIGEGDLVAQIQGLDLAGAFTSALGEDAMAPVGEAVVAGIGASVEGGAIEIADGLTSGYASALGTPEQQAALAALGEASLLAFAGGWRDAASNYDWAGALPPVTPTGATAGAVGSVAGAAGAPTALADGGYVARGGWAVVGERGPELAYLPTGANVYDNATSRRSGGVNVTVNVTANTPLDWEVAAQRIGQIVARKQQRRR